MPTPVAHALAGAGTYLLGRRADEDDKKVLGAAVIAACLADIDFGLSFLTGTNYHHYFTHSLGFTSFFSLAVFLWTRDLRTTAIVGGAYLSHVLLDTLSKDTAAPYGVELFWPVSDRFVISPILVFDDIWRGTLAKLLSAHNWLAVAREVVIVGPITAAIWLATSRGRTRRNPSRSSDPDSPRPPS